MVVYICQRLAPMPAQTPIHPSTAIALGGWCTVSSGIPCERMRVCFGCSTRVSLLCCCCITSPFCLFAFALVTHYGDNRDKDRCEGASCAEESVHIHDTETTKRHIAAHSASAFY